MEHRQVGDPSTVRLSEREEKARRARNIAIAIGLVALVGIFYASTVAKLGPKAMDRPVVTLAPEKESTIDPDFERIRVEPKEEVTQ